MKHILLNGKLVSYNITYKNNKHTYFRFKGNNHIEIYASKFQTKKQILKYMKNNETNFLKKLNRSTNKKSTSLKDKDVIMIFGNEYKIILKNGHESIKLYKDELIITSFDLSIDHIDLIYIKFIKKILLEEISNLQNKYINIVGFDISNIKFKTRFTTTRYGSCNPNLRTINFNLHLINYDKIYLEYVFLHEISHLVHKNHSSKFYELLESLCNEYLVYKKELNILFNT